MSETKIALSEMIEQLREELSYSKAMGEGEKIRFVPLEVTLEAQVTVSREVGGKGGVKFWLVNAEAGATRTTGQVQKLVLKLQPVGPDGESDLLLSGS